NGTHDDEKKQNTVHHSHVTDPASRSTAWRRRRRTTPIITGTSTVTLESERDGRETPRAEWPRIPGSRRCMCRQDPATAGPRKRAADARRDSPGECPVEVSRLQGAGRT